MLLAAAALTSMTARTIRTNPRYAVVCILLTASMAVGFFFIPQGWYAFWLIAAGGATGILFLKRPAEVCVETINPNAMSKAWLPPAFVILLAAGYLLDPVVSFTARHSNAPKGVIGFFVLATLTSWPEFKSTLSLLGRGLPLAAVLNITVSNITNIWLAMLGVLFFLIAN
jgi:cation:H+ antiporter